MAKNKRPQRQKNYVQSRSDVAQAAHRSGGGKHDNRPKRQRTRKDAIRHAIKEYS